MTNSSNLDEFVGQVDRVLDELSELANTATSASVYFDNLLARTNLILGAQASAIWHIGPNNSLLKSRSQGASAAMTDGGPDDLKAEIRQCITTLENQRYFRGKRKNEVFAILWPLKKVEPTAALAIYFHQKPNATDEPILSRVVEALAELADDYFATQVIRQRQQIEKDYGKLVRFANVVNQDLKVRQTSVTIANHCRDILDCNRASVLSKRGSQFVLVASSGTQQVNRRANSSRALEGLVRRVFHRNEKPVVHQLGETPNDAASTRMNAYCEQYDLQTLVLIPIRQKISDKTNFSLVLEFQKKTDEIATIIHKVNLIEPQIRSALNNARHYESLPFLQPMLMLQRMLSVPGSTKKSFYALLGLVCVALAIALLMLLQTDLKVHTRGILVSPSETNVFAPDDGLVSEVLVKHGDAVVKSQPILVLRSDELDLEITALQGKLDIAQKKLESQEVAMAAFERDDSENQQSNLIRLTGEIIETKEQISHFINELKILDARKSKLRINSPISGQIASWDLDRILANSRPVRRGDRLVQIVKNENRWLAFLYVPSDQISHIIDEDFQTRQEVQVRLSIASAPDVIFEGKIIEISKVAEPVEGNNFSEVKISVEFKTSDDGFENFRPGTTVVANLRCGRVSIAYALFHRVIRTIRFRFF